MIKKLVSILLIAAMVLLCGLTAFADNLDGTASDSTDKGTTSDNSKEDTQPSAEDILNSAVKDTKAFFVTITKPNADKDLTYKKTYVFSGVTDYEDVKIILKKYNPETKKYVPLKDEDGYSQWDVGSFGVFAKEIKLTKGKNEIRLLAYRTSDKDNLEVDKNIQVKNFTITLLDESLKDKIINTIIDIKDSLFDILPKK